MTLTRTFACLGVVAVGAAGLATAVPATAHTSLADSSPKDRATVAEPPTVVTLEFTEPVQRDFVQVAVLDADEVHYEDGEAVVDSSTVTQAVQELPAGDYQISYRVGSSDGHPVTGVLTFTVASQVEDDTEQTRPPVETQPPAHNSPPAETESPLPAEQPTASQVPAAGAEDSGSAMRWLGAGAAVAAAAALLFALLRRPGGGAARTESDTGPP